MANQDPSRHEKVPDDLRHVLVLGPPSVFKAYERQFSEKFRFLKPWESSLPLHQFLSSHAASVRAMFCSIACPITADVLQNLPGLRFIMASSTGVNHIDLRECNRRGVKVANAGSIYSQDVADMAVALLIDVLRRVSAANRYVKAGVWPQKGDYPLGHKLGGKRVGIVGMGCIGLNVAKRLDAFGCTVSYTSRTPKPHLTFPFRHDVLDLASDCDVLVVCCALTDQTRHLIDRNVLSALGKGGVVVNVARGPIVNEKHLVECLVNGDVAGAGLDVFEHEPDVPREMFTLDNVVLTPHQAMMTDESFGELYELVCSNLDAFFSNRPLLSEVMND